MVSGCLLSLLPPSKRLPLREGEASSAVPRHSIRLFCPWLGVGNAVTVCLGPVLPGLPSSSGKSLIPRSVEDVLFTGVCITLAEPGYSIRVQHGRPVRGDAAGHPSRLKASSPACPTLLRSVSLKASQNHFQLWLHLFFLFVFFFFWVCVRNSLNVQQAVTGEGRVSVACPLLALLC